LFGESSNSTTKYKALKFDSPPPSYEILSELQRIAIEEGEWYIISSANITN
jgi:hypothetical protein